MDDRNDFYTPTGSCRISHSIAANILSRSSYTLDPDQQANRVIFPSNLMARIDWTNAVLLATTLALSAGAIFILLLAM